MKPKIRLRKVSNYSLERINELFNEAHDLPIGDQQSKANEVLLWAEKKGYYTRIPVDQKAEDELREHIDKLTGGDEGACPHCIAIGTALGARLVAEGKYTADKLFETAMGIKFENEDDSEETEG
jgi:hypothetical protein